MFTAAQTPLQTIKIGRRILPLLITLMLCTAAYAAPLPLATDGRAEAEVVLDITVPQLQLEYAAQELTNWLKRITGAALPVTATPGDLPVKIHLGTPEHSPAVAAFAKKHVDDFASLAGNDGFIIAREGSAIYLAASCPKGVLNSVYRFLEKNSDIIFVRAYEAEDGCGTIYGNHPTLANTVEMLVDVPALKKQRYWTSFGPNTAIWQARLLNSFTRSMDLLWPAFMTAMEKAQQMDERVSRLSLSLIDPAKYFAEHPDYFPLVRGNRITQHDSQLCFMNPHMIEAFGAEAAKIAEAQPQNVVSYIIGHGDNWDLCECEEYCNRPIKLPDGTVVKPGDANFRSTQYTLFTNAVWDYLMARFPHIKPYCMMAYLFTSTAPAVKPRSGKVQYCPYIKNHKKPVFDDKANAVWRQRAESFKTAGIAIAELYEYYLCHTTPQFYHAIGEVAQQDLKYYQGMGLEGCYLDTAENDSPNDRGGHVFDISAIEFWVMSRLMWNPDIDLKETRREFCRRAYREAAAPMIAYYERLGEVYNSDPTGCFWNDDPIAACRHYVLDKGLTGFVRQQLDEALKLAQHPGSRRLIELHRNRMLGMIETAEKMPPRVSLRVPLMKKAPTTADVQSPEWAGAAEIEGLTRISDASTPSPRATRVRLAHDISNLYLALRMDDPLCYDNWKDGKYPPQPGRSDWSSLLGPTMEIFFDGDLKTAGSYYQAAFAINGNQYTGRSTTQWKENPPAWAVRCEVKPGYWQALVTIPLTKFGVVVSQGNKLGFMIVGNEGAWNGGQWHSPTGFQTLVLEME